MRSHLVLGVLLVGVVVLCISLWVNEGPLWRLVMLKKIPYHKMGPMDFEGHVLRCEMMVNRWTHASPRWPIVYYYLDTGCKAIEKHEEGEFLKETYWNYDGSVRAQILSQIVDKEGVAVGKVALGKINKRTPPWLWGVKDQTEPSAPWWHEKDK